MNLEEASIDPVKSGKRYSSVSWYLKQSNV